MEKKEMVAGQKYRGYGLINEYGEFEFIPEDTGSRRDTVKTLKTGNGFTVSYTSKSVLVHMKLSRKKKWPTAMLADLSEKFSNVFRVIKQHEM